MLDRHDHEKPRIAALGAVRQACRLCRAVRDTLVSAETLAKKDKSPVTVADYGVQAIIISELVKAFPDVPVVGEEDASELLDPANAVVKDRVVEQARRVDASLDERRILAAIDRGAHAGGAHGRFWTLDPIDGTKGFLRGEQYAIALALIEEGEVVLGVLGCPNLPLTAVSDTGAATAGGQARPCGCLFVAARGQGAFKYSLDGGDGTPVRVADVADPRPGVFLRIGRVGPLLSQATRRGSRSCWVSPRRRFASTANASTRP